MNWYKQIDGPKVRGCHTKRVLYICPECGSTDARWDHDGGKRYCYCAECQRAREVAAHNHRIYA